MIKNLDFLTMKREIYLKKCRYSLKLKVFVEKSTSKLLKIDLQQSLDQG